MLLITPCSVSAAAQTELSTDGEEEYSENCSDLVPDRHTNHQNSQRHHFVILLLLIEMSISSDLTTQDPVPVRMTTDDLHTLRPVGRTELLIGKEEIDPDNCSDLIPALGSTDKSSNHKPTNLMQSS